MKRVLVAALHHESNPFSPIVTKREDFHILVGEELFDNIRENDSLSGVITTLQSAGLEVVPTLSARAVPNGVVDKTFFLEIKQQILDMARQAHAQKPLDAITLSLHGSMRIEEIGDAEGIFLQELRALFPELPIFSSLDMHATMTEAMHRSCDGFVGYKSAPHIDCTETGAHAARMTIAALQHGVRARTAWVRVPFLVAGEQSATTVQPMKQLISRLREIEKQPGVMAASYLMGFPWADHSDSAVAVYIVTDHDQALADRLAISLAQELWSSRKAFCFVTETYDPHSALDKAYEAVQRGEGPVYLSDSGDNPTAGASADQTDFLKLILADGRQHELSVPIIYGGLYDPQATAHCAAHVGEEIVLSFGGAFDQTVQPITAQGTVTCHLKDWQSYSLIKSDLACFHTQGVDIILTSQHVGFLDPHMFEVLGLEPKKARIIVCKLGYLTPEHEAIAARSILALTKGNTNEDLSSIDYRTLSRPIYPLDVQMSFDAEKELIHK